MNDLLQLKGSWQSKAHPAAASYAQLPAHQELPVEKLENIITDLKSSRSFWEQHSEISGALLHVHHTKVMAKSNRIRGLFSHGINSADAIVGARFEDMPASPKHVITYYVTTENLQQTIDDLNTCVDILKEEYTGCISSKALADLQSSKAEFASGRIKKRLFAAIICDAYYIRHISPFDRPAHPKDNQDVLVTFYNTQQSIDTLLNKLHLDIRPLWRFDDCTIRLTAPEFKVLYQRAPHLIAMAVTDLNSLTPQFSGQVTQNTLTIRPPHNEPVIGVIDTPFCQDVYFSEWVSYHHCLDPAIHITAADMYHGTAVTSIIVDGHSLNPELDDGCGYFRVRHFGIATKGFSSSVTILRQIRQIVSENRDIKVWNLSLGSALETEMNYISPEAADLDQLQMEFDIIFVVAGTNRTNDNPHAIRIGAPADSINSLVVNSITKDGTAASYTRRGPVLAFYNKPDVSYYGGDQSEPLNAYVPNGIINVYGTSFATPWISRKLAYLIHIMGFSREIAKALLIDASAGWLPLSEKDSIYTGYGAVPIHIQSILQSPEDEIKFFINGISSTFDTYTFNIPVPIHQGIYPYFAKATMCYFSSGSRNQGVDYTDTELDLHIGRIKENGIKAINGNTQNESSERLYEETARLHFRKWDNVKYVAEELSPKARGRKVYPTPLWGISVKKTERHYRSKHKVPFGLVITLKAMDHKNRIESFIQHCFAQRWIVNRINVQQHIELYNNAEEELEWDLE